jgi:hypothetical protein
MNRSQILLGIAAFALITSLVIGYIVVMRGQWPLDSIFLLLVAFFLVCLSQLELSFIGGKKE